MVLFSNFRIFVFQIHLIIMIFLQINQPFVLGIICPIHIFPLAVTQIEAVWFHRTPHFARRTPGSRFSKENAIFVLPGKQIVITILSLPGYRGFFSQRQMQNSRQFVQRRNGLKKVLWRNAVSNQCKKCFDRLLILAMPILRLIPDKIHIQNYTMIGADYNKIFFPNIIFAKYPFKLFRCDLNISCIVFTHPTSSQLTIQFM